MIENKAMTRKMIAPDQSNVSVDKQSMRLTLLDKVPDADSNVENNSGNQRYLQNSLCECAQQTHPDDSDRKRKRAAAEQKVNGVAGVRAVR